MQEPGDQHIEYQSEVELYCKPPRGDPAPLITWEFNGKSLNLGASNDEIAKFYLKTRNSLILRNVDLGVGGVYRMVF